MKNLKLFMLIILLVLVGYFLGTRSSKESIQGSIEFSVKAQMEDTMTPIPNLEIDFASQPGPPPEGGVGLTDENGVAKFNVKAGDYFIYFNDNTFPKNLNMPEPQLVSVSEGAVNERIILFSTKD